MQVHLSMPTRVNDRQLSYSRQPPSTERPLLPANTRFCIGDYAPMQNRHQAAFCSLARSVQAVSKDSNGVHLAVEGFAGGVHYGRPRYLQSSRSLSLLGFNSSSLLSQPKRKALHQALFEIHLFSAGRLHI